MMMVVMVKVVVMTDEGVCMMISVEFCVMEGNEGQSCVYTHTHMHACHPNEEHEPEWSTWTDTGLCSQLLKNARIQTPWVPA